MVAHSHGGNLEDTSDDEDRQGAVVVEELEVEVEDDKH